MGGDVGVRPSKNILAASNLPALTGFASSNVLLAFDYDGTLAPIVRTPAHARMRGETRRLLTLVARRYPCVVISGRRLADVTARLNGVPVWYVFGNHGHEPTSVDQPPPPQIAEWVRRLNEHLPSRPGLVIEEKQYSVTIHYRNVHDKKHAMQAIDLAVGGLTDARKLQSPQAITLLPQGGSDKGLALQHARQLFACSAAIYVGDDETDEDAFRSDVPDRLLSIRVGASASTAARYLVPGQTDVDELLRTMLALRPRRPRAAADTPKEDRHA
jgi:trehalose 6-phosphate phosphatase